MELPSLIMIELGIIYVSAVLLVIVWRVLPKNLRKTFSYVWIAATFLIALMVLAESSIAYTVTMKPKLYIFEEIFRGIMAIDSFSLSINFAVLLSSFLMAMHVLGNLDYSSEKTEGYLVLLLILVGTALCITTTNNFVALIVFWEACIASAIGVLAHNVTEEGGEALTKMILMSLVSAVSMTIGIGLLYAALATAYAEPLGIYSLNFHQVALLIQNVRGYPLYVLLLSFAFIVASLGIEIGMAPFHMWLPDIYTGARPYSLSLVVLTLEMTSAYAITRVLGIYSYMPVYIGALSLPIAILVVFSTLSVIVGEVSALVQRRLRRIVGYSAVADAGYILLLSLFFLTFKRVPIGENSTYALPIAFFILVSNISLASSVALIGLLERRGIYTLDDARGLVRRWPLLGILLSMSLMSVFGAPPLAGFIAKFFVVTSLASSIGMASYILFIAAIVTLMFAVSSAYSLRIIQYTCIYSIAPKVSELIKKEPLDLLAPLTLLVALLLVLGVAPFIITSMF